jgi:mono/diheme cytochrome c family protein
MLRKIAKWTGIVIGSLIALLLIGYFFIANNISRRIDKQYTFADQNLTIPTDSATLNRGKHLAVIKGCIECHGADLSGKTMIDDAGLGRLSARNLTKGKGGLSADYSTTDWVRALRHGVDKSGHPLLFMPSHETTLLSEDDMAAIIAYCQSVPSVNHTLPPHRIGPIVNVMAYLDKMPLFPVEKIDHKRSIVAKIDTSGGIAQGKYLAVSCSGCHQPTFKGGESPAPGMLPPPDLTTTGHVGKWTQAQFINTLRTGKTPSGHQLKNDEMPWKMTAQYSNKELASLYKYFRSLK